MCIYMLFYLFYFYSYSFSLYFLSIIMFFPSSLFFFINLQLNFLLFGFIVIFWQFRFQSFVIYRHFTRKYSATSPNLKTKGILTEIFIYKVIECEGKLCHHKVLNYCIIHHQGNTFYMFFCNKRWLEVNFLKKKKK